MSCFVSRFAAVLLLVVAGTLTPAAAGERPIGAKGQGTFLFDFDAYSAQLVGQGKGEHLGGCFLLIYLDFEALSNYGHLVPQALMLEAANGDRVIGTVDSEFDPTTGNITGTIMFTEGTGRFADVTGSARLLIVPDVLHWGSPRFSWALEGTIDY